MAELKPCPACRRHITVVETTCPFCSASVELAPSSPLRLGRVSRAAVFAAGAALATTAGCGGKKKPVTQQQQQQQQQQQTAPADAGVQQPDQIPDKHEAMPYGAPPARRRLV